MNSVDDSRHEPAGGRTSTPLAQSLLRRLINGGAATLLRLIDHMLDQNDWARDKLAMHAGRIVRIGIDLPPLPGLPPPQLLARVDDRGRLEHVPSWHDADADAAAAAPSESATMLLQPSVDAAFTLAREGPRGLTRHLRIDGDAMLAATLDEIARHLRWDIEEDLSRVTGDALAHRIGRTVSSGVAGARELRARLESSAGHWLSGESAQLASRSELQTFSRALDALDARLAELARAASPQR